mgnify:FL=1
MKSVQTPYQRLRLGDSNLLVALDKNTQVQQLLYSWQPTIAVDGALAVVVVMPNQNRQHSNC